MVSGPLTFRRQQWRACQTVQLVSFIAFENAEQTVALSAEQMLEQILS